MGQFLDEPTAAGAQSAPTGQFLDEAPPTTPTTPEPSTLSKIGGIVGEELAATPGRMVEGAKSGLSSLWDTIRNPKMSDTLPLAIGGPAMKGAAAAATQAAPGIMGRFAQGASRAGATGLGTAIDTPGGADEKVEAGLAAAGTAALWESAFGLGQKLGSSKVGLPSLNTMSGRQGAYDWATRAPMEAYEKIKDRVPQGYKIFVPTIDAKKQIPIKEAAEKLGGLQRQEYDAALKEIVAELNWLDARRMGAPELAGQALRGRKPPRPSYAGSAFESHVAPERFAPSAASQTGAKVAAGVKTPLAREAADIVASKENEDTGVPQGALPALYFGEPLVNMARRWLPPGVIPGGGGATR